MRHRLLQPARICQPVGQVVLRAFIIRLQLQHGAKLNHRSLGLSLSLQGQPQIMVGQAGIRVQPQGLLIIGNRLRGLPRIHQGIGQVEVIKIFGFEPDCGQIVLEGFVEALLPQQHLAEVVVRLGVIGLDLQRRLIMLHRLRQLVLSAIQVSHVVVRHVIALEDCDHPLKKSLAPRPVGNLFPCHNHASRQ